MSDKPSLSLIAYHVESLITDPDTYIGKDNCSVSTSYSITTVPTVIDTELRLGEIFCSQTRCQSRKILITRKKRVLKFIMCDLSLFLCNLAPVPFQMKYSYTLTLSARRQTKTNRTSNFESCLKIALGDENLLLFEKILK